MVKKNAKIQVVRGLCCIAVVSIHCLPEGSIKYLIKPLLNFCVGVYLFLSGMLTLRNDWNPKRRILKVILPYILWTFLYVCIENRNNIVSIPIEFFKGLIKADKPYMMYFIPVYCQLTLLFPILHRFAVSKYKYIPLLISPIEIITFRLIPLITGIEINPVIASIMHISCLGWVNYYYFGYLIGNGFISLHIRVIYLVLLYSASLVIQYFETMFYILLGSDSPGTQLKLTAIFSGLLACLLFYDYIYRIPSANNIPTSTWGRLSEN